MKQVKLWMIVVILFCGSPAHAEEYRNQQKAEEKTVIEVPQWMKNIRLSGYGMVQYQTTYEDKYEEEADVPLNRYCLSAEYDRNDYTFRTEYIHSQGWGTGVIGSNVIDYLAIYMAEHKIYTK